MSMQHQYAVAVLVKLMLTAQQTARAIRDNPDTQGSETAAKLIESLEGSAVELDAAAVALAKSEAMGNMLKVSGLLIKGLLQIVAEQGIELRQIILSSEAADPTPIDTAELLDSIDKITGTHQPAPGATH